MTLVQGLVDELRILVHPVLLGRGRSLFAGLRAGAVTADRSGNSCGTGHQAPGAVRQVLWPGASAYANALVRKGSERTQLVVHALQHIEVAARCAFRSVGLAGWAHRTVVAGSR